MPFGLTNTPATFMQAISLVLQGFQWNQVLAYLDDISGRNFKYHLLNIRETLSRFQKFNLKLKP